MPIFAWTPEFSVGIQVIDEQRKKLVETINILHDAMKEGQSKSVLADVFSRMIEYVGLHFATEENFMISFGYPAYQEHKRDHDYCTKKSSNLSNLRNNLNKAKSHYQ